MSLVSFKNAHNRKLVIVFWIIGLALGSFQAWSARHHMGADGISYLDVADAYMRGDWATAINAYWSPLYSWILGLAMTVLKPSPYYEFTVVHIVNIVIYLCTLGSFHFFITQLVGYHQAGPGNASENSGITFPDWAWIALGYSLFLQSSLNLIGVWDESPDMCMATFVYLASGILLRIRRGATNYQTYVLLGMTLGFGYLVKAVMFPLSFIFLSVSILSTGNIRKALPRTMTALLVFLLIATPFIFGISHAKGRFTFGDAGKFNYWFHVNGHANFQWAGAPPGSGTPRHAPRIIFDKPTVFEFGTPVGGTYPLWYDPSYWNDGIETRIDLKKQIQVIKTSVKNLYHLLYPRYSVLIFCSLILYLMGRRRWSFIRDLVRQWELFIPGITALSMYSLINIDYRYVGPFLPLLWLGVFSAIRLPDTEDTRRLLRYVTVIMVLVMTLVTMRHIAKITPPESHVQWQAADALHRMGILPEDRVASIGNSHSHFWARLARIRIVSEIPHKEAGTFWDADDRTKSNVFETLRNIGVKAVVTELVPSRTLPNGWQRLGNTGYYVYKL